tara:strand:+ start:1331 stop:2113 length:783 start_codon:yes stop_codon:yes gene_type:complete
MNMTLHPTKILKMASMVVIPIAISIFAVWSVIASYEMPPAAKIQQNNFTDFYSPQYKRAIEKSRKSAVQVISLDSTSIMLSSASGTYFTSYGDFFVVTVYHGIQGPCELTMFVHDGNMYDCIEYVVLDSYSDYAIIQTEKIEDRVPIEIPDDLPKSQSWIGSYSVMNKLVYTGYPNTIGPLTIAGDVAGFIEPEYIYMNSYAWSGSSGSGVFDHTGKYIGYVIALDVGQTEFGVQVLPNVVLVAPSFNIDWSQVRSRSAR